MSLGLASLGRPDARAEGRPQGAVERPARHGARYLHYLVLLLARCVLFPLYVLAGAVPRRRDLWVFGSWGGYRFADNAAAFFEHCRRHVTGVELVWISRRFDTVRDLRARGIDAHWVWSPSGIAKCARAGLYLFDCFSKDINFWLSRGAIKINLWSGVPLKTFERDIDNPRNRYYQLFHGPPLRRWLLAVMMPWHVQKPDLIIATSEETAEITRRAFALDGDRVAITGFPRNDALLEPEPGSAKLPGPFREAVEAGRRVFLYLPTFRDNGKPFLEIDWPRLERLMTDLDATFFLKFHPVDSGHFKGKFAHIVELGQDVDVYSLLPHTTALISDYSSVIFDYMLLAKPVVSYVPDLDEFVRETRKLNFHPLEVATGPVCTNVDELLAALERIGRGEHAADEARVQRIVRRLHTHAGAGAGRRVLRLIEQRFLARGE